MTKINAARETTSQVPTGTLAERDARVCWHPYTQHGAEAEPLHVASAKDSVLTLADGSQVIDAISSWWAILHGHGNEQVADAMAHQARTLDHVLFAGATHEPAVRLAERLVEITPPSLTRVFYSDDGSTAVEVALKMVIQWWQRKDETQRTTFIAFDGAYHGDTFGAMAIGDPDPFFEPFAAFCFKAQRVAPDLAAIEVLLDELGEQTAGVIIEPLVQGAAGMVMQTPEFLRGLRKLTQGRGIPLIADEVMTGFGRTGAMFACDVAGIEPDLMCLAKGLTGGMTPMSVTMAGDEHFEAFLSDKRSDAFFHGHTFTAHPIGCAAALASLDVVLETNLPKRLNDLGLHMEAKLRDLLQERLASGAVTNLRQCGGIVAFDINVGDAGYLASIAPELRKRAVEHGVLLRPLGNVLYAMPPASTTIEQADRIAEVMVAILP